MKTVIDDKIPFIRGVLEPYAEVSYLPASVCAHGNGTEVDADALIVRTRTKCNEATLSGSSVKFIATATIGFDHIDTQWCEANGIRWTNAPGCNSGSVRQYVAAVLAVLAARYGFAFGDMTLGVVGVGNVGAKVAQLGRELGMNVLLNDPPRARMEGTDAFVSLEEIVRRSDIVTLHVPLDCSSEDRTFRLFDAEMLSRMKSSAMLINSSRGEVVDNSALKTALQRKTIKAATLDVWENEPEIDCELLSLIDIATPHIAGYSADGKANGTAMSVQALSRHFGLPLTDWYPAEMPTPAQPLHFSINGSGKTQQQCICEAILHTYPIADDDRRLRQSIETFEKQRGDYPVRREFEAFSIRTENMPQHTVALLKRLGFKI
ncbi:MAG: 4-phosphoerythronate dehydrogenase [Bacteroidales bacterium]|jgi:erythronate-4-phosphate dehydrogenase|nr:4-phosphoerythronate dehydrogenase [Bacteroidales bacterium]